MPHVSALEAEGNHQDTSQHSCSVSSSCAHQPQVEPLTHVHWSPTLDRDLNSSGWMCHCGAPTCWGQLWSLGWNAFSKLTLSGWKTTMTHCSLYTTPTSIIFCFETFCNSSSETTVFCFNSTHQRNNRRKVSDCDEWLFSVFLPVLSPVIFSTGRQCASTAWRTLSGPSREISCTRRGLSISGRSLQARCPIHDLERWVNTLESVFFLFVITFYRRKHEHHQLQLNPGTNQDFLTNEDIILVVFNNYIDLFSLSSFCLFVCLSVSQQHIWKL